MNHIELMQRMKFVQFPFKRELQTSSCCKKAHIVHEDKLPTTL